MTWPARARSSRNGAASASWISTSSERTCRAERASPGQRAVTVTGVADDSLHRARVALDADEGHSARRPARRTRAGAGRAPTSGAGIADVSRPQGTLDQTRLDLIVALKRISVRAEKERRALSSQDGLSETALLQVSGRAVLRLAERSGRRDSNSGPLVPQASQGSGGDCRGVARCVLQSRSRHTRDGVRAVCGGDVLGTDRALFDMTLHGVIVPSTTCRREGRSPRAQ